MRRALGGELRGDLRALFLTTTMIASVSAGGIAAAQDSKPGAVQLTPIEVEGRKARDIETDIAITATDIERDNPQSVKELFQTDPAVTVAGGSLASQKFYVHGMDQSKLNVTIDGAAHRNNVWHHNGNIILDPMFLKSVEIDAGISAADRGPGALGGSVRFETKDAADMLLPGHTKGGTAILSYDTNSETVRATGAGYARTQGFEIMGIGTRADGSDYENGKGATEPGTADDLWSGLAKLAYESDKGHRIEWSGELMQDEGMRRLRPNMGFVNNDLNYNKAIRRTTTISYATTRPTDLFAPEIMLYFNQNELERPNRNGYTRASGDFNSKTDSIGGKLANSFAIPYGDLTVGVDFYRDEVFVERFHFATNAEEEVGNVGAFAQFRLKPTPRLSISTGIRADYQSYDAVDGKSFDNGGLSPNVSAEYAVTDQVTAFGGYSYNWGGIELAETALFHARDYRYASDLDPATAHNIKAGLRYRQGGLQLEGTLFRTLVENPVDYDFAAATRINGKDLETRGFDLAAGYRWQNAFVGAKYSHTDIEYGDRMALYGDYNNGVPVGDILTLNAYYTFADIALTVGGSSEIAFEIEDQALTDNGYRPIEAYEVVNLYAEWRPDHLVPNWSLRVEANNLFDEDYYSRGTYAESARVTPVYSPGRSFLISSVLKF